MREVRLEVCVDTPDGLGIAVASGSDRIELCSSLISGGLTPSLGMMNLAAVLSCPVRVMIRPREGDFTYSAAEVDLMMRDIDGVAEAGLDGVVMGANRPGGELDETVLRRLVGHAAAAGLKTTLHRSFDLTPDLQAALAIASDLGFDSLLTSGGAPDALSGRDALRDLVMQAQADGRHIEIMAGVGVGSKTARAIIEHSGIGWVHGSCSRPRPAISPDAVRLGYASPRHRMTDGAEIVRLLRVLEALGEAAETGHRVNIE
jgi:copper homeostasis protein